MKERVRRLARKAGYDIRRFTPTSSPDAQLKAVFDCFGVDLVIDVGANIGQYGQLLRQLDYRGTILSFEPLADAHAALAAAAADDANWRVAPRMAIGASDGSIKINVAGNSASSSVLPMLDRHLAAAPGSAYRASEDVDLRRLSTAVSLAGFTAPFLKIDTQGYERAVLDGAGAVLDAAVAVQAELSLMPLYDGGVGYREMLDRFEREGFELWSLWPGFADPASGRLLQADVIVTRPEARIRSA